MKRVLVLTAVILVCGLRTAGAQVAPAAAPVSERGYVMVTGGGAFGNKTSSVIGGEIGVRVTPMLDVFVEGGRIKDTIASDVVTRAQPIVGFLGKFGTAGFTAEQPATYFAVGAKVNFAINDRAKVYAMVGGGGAKVEYKTAFTLGGTDVTDSLLSKYGVALGGDLASVSDQVAMLTAGAGVHVLAGGPIVVDASYRFGRISVPDAPLTTSRLQIGVGIKF